MESLQNGDKQVGAGAQQHESEDDRAQLQETVFRYEQMR